MDTHALINRRFWDEIAPLHAASDFYDVKAFLDGASTLDEIDRAEVGDVAGKDLLHLMCHIGLDTLSWARAGARVTGVDFSVGSLDIARDLAARTGTAATFVCADVLEAADRLGATFDVVYLSRGVLMWVADITSWARTCARLLEPGGAFYLLDNHPVALSIVEEGGRLSVDRSYFPEEEPAVVRSDGSYAVHDAGLANTETREWIHPVGEVVTALAEAGIRIEFVHEFPARPASPAPPGLPALFSIRGVRE